MGAGTVYTQIKKSIKSTFSKLSNILQCGNVKVVLYIELKRSDILLLKFTAWSTPFGHSLVFFLAAFLYSLNSESFLQLNAFMQCPTP